MAQRKVLIVDDDRVASQRLEEMVERLGLSTVVLQTGRAALDTLGVSSVSVVLTSWSLPDMDGATVLQALGRNFPQLPVIVVARRGSIAGAVQAMRAGAVDYLPCPVGAMALTESLARLRHDRSDLGDEGSVHSSRDRRLIGASDEFVACVERIERAAQGATTVLLRGESGTGKELAAREIHRRSDRAAAPFVKVHCAAIPDTLLESELFGYERGAFTGAIGRKLGRVDLARGGTLFLDEVGDVRPAIQVKLLSLLQDREYERLGGTETLQADVRLVTATNRDLEAMVVSGELREDLFYRLNVLPLWMPPLRERGNDAILLARHFCALLGAQNRKSGLRFEPGALPLFVQQPWPGNVRQLQNVVERLVVVSDGDLISRAAVMAELAHLTERPSDLSSARPPSTVPPPLERHRLNAEREALLEALRATRFNRTQAASMLGVSRRTLYNRLRAHGLQVETSSRKPSRQPDRR